MKLKAMLTAFVVCFAPMASPALAQDRDEAKEQLQSAVMDAADRLKLTDEQKPKVEDILMESTEKRKAVLDRYGVKQGEKPNLNLRQMRSLRGEMETIRQDTLEKMGGVLTAEQLAEFEKIQNEMREQLREQMRSRR
ncbi:MAG: Spy/CpxP family protein refolding chaperone [Alphaproteobacteria bacterium]